MKAESGTTGQAEAVRRANRCFYDLVADSYECLDGRRTPKVEGWLKANLAALRKQSPGGNLLDLGTGGGLVTRCARGIFDLRVGVDASPLVLRGAGTDFDMGIAADAGLLPFQDGFFDAVTCFAVLHHLYDPEKVVAEAARVLKPGGVFYSDHDMDRTFFLRFEPALRLYRRLRRPAEKYRRACPMITEELYRLSEWKEDGIESGRLLLLLEAAGFSAEASFHWFGLNAITNALFGQRRRQAGMAPLVAIRARKKR